MQTSGSDSGKRVVTSDSTERCRKTPEQYRALAWECSEWANKAQMDHERQIFLQVAKAWSTVAELAEKVRPLEDVLDTFFDRSPTPNSTIQ
jgi:hypothetical protein